jgi:hypothetical protein
MGKGLLVMDDTYELNNVDLCLMVHIYQKRKNHLHMLSILQRITEEIWHKKTHIHR